MLNGEYRGLYLGHAEVLGQRDRVDIPEQKATDTGNDKISGGYLIEVDAEFSK